MISNSSNYWENYRIGITGAKGALGKALIKKLRSQGAYLIGITHSEILSASKSNDGPQEWVSWKCGEESSLENTLAKLDILILNHGINPQGNQTSNDLNRALEINALSNWRLIESFQSIPEKYSSMGKSQREIWINTSEAEIQPALSPGYELSKRLIGQLVSLKWSNLSVEQKKYLKIRKLILGPFHSELNPVGLMTAEWVAGQIINQARLGFNLIIVTPNPLTYFLMPITELSRMVYSKLLQPKKTKN